jgi:hypothetical protein
MGFARAFAIGNAAEFTKELSRPIGLLWLFTGLLFIISAILMLVRKEGWPMFAFLAILVSQLLIFTVWNDAKYGTLANVVILIAAIIAFASERFESSYKKDVVSVMESAPAMDERITEKDLEHLPSIVQKYLNYVGVVGKPKIQNVKIVFEGEMRDKGKDWFKFTSEQYNFFDSPTRLFFMKAKVKGLPTSGYHKYTKEGATMKIKLVSLFPVVNIDTPELFPTETVTFFNDLCLFAPAVLIDDRITWETLNNTSVKATFTTNNRSIAAILYFNETGQLVNFVSNDRYSVSEMKAFPFSTPAKDYQNINGYMLPTYGEAVWNYLEGEFTYGKFNVKSVEYNVPKLK